MSKLPRQSKILPSDFPDQKWMPKFLAQLNGFMEDVTRALNKNLTLKENLAAEIMTVSIDGTFPLDVLWANKAYPTAAWIGQCREASGSHTTFTDPLYLDWEMSSRGLFRINNIAGLSASPSAVYSVTIMAVIA